MPLFYCTGRVFQEGSRQSTSTNRRFRTNRTRRRHGASFTWRYQRATASPKASPEALSAVKFPTVRPESAWGGKHFADFPGTNGTAQLRHAILLTCGIPASHQLRYISEGRSSVNVFRSNKCCRNSRQKWHLPI